MNPETVDMLVDTIAIIVFLVAGGLGGYMITSGIKRIELLRLRGKIHRVRRLADRWEREAGPAVSSTTAGPVWEQLRYELDLDEKVEDLL